MSALEYLQAGFFVTLGASFAIGLFSLVVVLIVLCLGANKNNE